MSVILVVDDDPALVRTLTINLRSRGYQVETANNGRTALEIVNEQVPDLILLDLGLPDLDGIAVLTQLRTTSAVPVLVLSARHSADDKVEALDLGADDYVTKPFGMDELLARIRVTLRRSPGAGAAAPRIIDAGDLQLDLDNQLALRNGTPIHLTPTEWRLMRALAREPGQLVRQQDLLREVWGPSYHRQSNYLRVYLANLRRKLEAEPGRPRHLITEAGVGHRFVL